MKKKTAKKPKEKVTKSSTVDVKRLQEALKSVDAANVDRIAFHLRHVEQFTGRVLEEDITYCLNLDRRMRNKVIEDLKK